MLQKIRLFLSKVVKNLKVKIKRLSVHGSIMHRKSGNQIMACAAKLYNITAIVDNTLKLLPFDGAICNFDSYDSILGFPKNVNQKSTPVPQSE